MNEGSPNKEEKEKFSWSRLPGQPYKVQGISLIGKYISIQFLRVIQSKKNNYFAQILMINFLDCKYCILVKLYKLVAPRRKPCQWRPQINLNNKSYHLSSRNVCMLALESIFFLFFLYISLL